MSKLLYVVLSLRPGSKWKPLTKPITREEAVKRIATQWESGHLARLAGQVEAEPRGPAEIIEIRRP